MKEAIMAILGTVEDRIAAMIVEVMAAEVGLHGDIVPRSGYFGPCCFMELTLAEEDGNLVVFHPSKRLLIPKKLVGKTGLFLCDTWRLPFDFLEDERRGVVFLPFISTD
jgi:hypothetical protein